MMPAVGLTSHILNNHLKSTLLLAGFPLLLAGMCGAFFMGLDALQQPPGGVDWQRASQSAIFQLRHMGIWILLGTGIWFTVAYFFHGMMMRAATHSIPVTRNEMPEIYNLLENLCISRGIKMPKFEVIDSPALNAYATGINDKTYKIVLTRGIIERLSTDELEGVIAHELTHIINRDVRLMIIAIIFVGIFSFLAEITFRMLISGSRPRYYNRGNNRNGGGMIIVMLLGLAILVVGYLLALVIRFALSRKREYLADAGAVELTKNPDAMMRALQRISGQDRIKGFPPEVEQMCIENSHAFMGMFATHPPINDRIQTLSRMTGVPVPEPTVSLRRGPSKPWDNGVPGPWSPRT